MPDPAATTERHDETYDAVMATYRTMERQSSELLSKMGLTRPRFQVLKIIAKDGPMSMRAIGDKMLVTAANVTGIIDRLESDGLIKRTPRRGDRRTKIIELTPKGESLQERVASIFSEFLRNALRAFTPEEQSTLRELLAKLQVEMSKLEE